MQRSYHHLGGQTPLLGSTIDDLLRATIARYPEEEAIVSVAQKRRQTYREFDAAIEAVARGLLALGLEKGSRVGIWSTDNLEWVVLQMATARIGAVLVNINPAYRPGELLVDSACAAPN